MTDPGASPRPIDVQGRFLRLGRYEVFYRLGTGGMASVYLGRLRGQGGFERLVAIKRIHEHLAFDPSFLSMFLDEARLVARLSHPNIVQVTDMSEEAEHPFLVMEYVDGETLSSVLTAYRRARRAFPVEAGARIVAQALEGLHQAHELKGRAGDLLGLVHRDISPQNIMVSYDGHVKLTDFGIVKAIGQSTQTRTGYIKGKTAYLSPEQALTQPVDRRSDIFAMGIVLYEATTGYRLFREESEFKTLQRITTGDVPHPTTLIGGYPPALEAVVLKALQIQPQDRFQNAREMQAALEKIIIKLGRPVGAVEIAELLRPVFADRIYSKRKLLEKIVEDNTTLSPATDISEEPSSLSLPLGLPAEKTERNNASAAPEFDKAIDEATTSVLSPGTQQSQPPFVEMQTTTTQSQPPFEEMQTATTQSQPALDTAQSTKSDFTELESLFDDTMPEGEPNNDRSDQQTDLIREIPRGQLAQSSPQFLSSRARLVILSLTLGSLLILAAAVVLILDLGEAPTEEEASIVGGSFNGQQPTNTLIARSSTDGGAASDVGPIKQRRESSDLDASSAPMKTPPDISPVETRDASPVDSEEDSSVTDASNQIDPSPAAAPRWRAQERRVPRKTQSYGLLTAITDPWCEVYLGGRRLGRTPFMKVKLPAGTHRLQLRPQGKGPRRSVSVRVRPDEVTHLSLKLGPQ